MSVRIGIIGTGFARRVQLPALRLVPGVTVTAIASGSLERARAVAAEFAIPHAFGSGEELARASDVDLVLVSSTPDCHARQAIAALEAGKHVLCEKPMALDTRQAARMVEVAERSPGLARIDHELRYELNRVAALRLLRERATVPCCTWSWCCGRTCGATAVPRPPTRPGPGGTTPRAAAASWAPLVPISSICAAFGRRARSWR